MSPQEVTAERGAARGDFHALRESATSGKLSGRAPAPGGSPSNRCFAYHSATRPRETFFRWSSRSCGSHMPARGGSQPLKVATRPFHALDYASSLGGARLLGRARMERLMARTIESMTRSVSRASQARLDRRMRFPASWDPGNRDLLALWEMCRHVTEHRCSHRNQLTLSNAARSSTRGQATTAVSERAERRGPA